MIGTQKVIFMNIYMHVQIYACNNSEKKNELEEKQGASYGRVQGEEKEVGNVIKL